MSIFCTRHEPNRDAASGLAQAWGELAARQQSRLLAKVSFGVRDRSNVEPLVIVSTTRERVSMRFGRRKSIKVAPGVRINLSKSGVSTSLGPRGAKVNISKRGVRATTRIPGTGRSYSTSLGSKTRTRRSASRRVARTSGCACCVPILGVFLAGPVAMLLVGFRTLATARSARGARPDVTGHDEDP